VPANSMEISKTIGHIATRWQEVDKPLLRHIFPLLAEGKPVPLTRLAQVTGKDIATLERALLHGHTKPDLRGRVTELFGITLSPTLHRIRVGHTLLFSCCALISHTLSALVGQTTTVESLDPLSRKVVQLTVSPSGLQSVNPQFAVGTLAVTQEEEVFKDVRAAFCSHVCHFASAESAATFVNGDARRYVVAIKEFHEAAEQLRATIWG